MTVAVGVVQEPLLLYKLLTNSTPAACHEPPSVEAADNSQARGPLPDLSYDDSQSCSCRFCSSGYRQ